MKTVKKYRFLHRRFPVNYLKYFRTAFLGNTFQRLLSDLGKYLKMLAIIIPFAEYFWIFGICENSV